MFYAVDRKSYLMMSTVPITAIEERTNQQNAQINFGLINLLLFNHSDMFRPLNWSHPEGV